MAFFMTMAFAAPARAISPMTIHITIPAGSASKTLTLPFSALTGTIDWGDSNIDNPSGLNSPSHTYTTTGTFTITVTGTATRYGTNGCFGANGASFITAIDDWGSFADPSTGLISLAGAFAGNSNLTAVPATLPPTVTNLSNAFCGATIFNGNISSWDTSHITNLSWAFYKAAAFNQNINNWDVHNVTTIQCLFREAVAFNQPLNSWNTASLTNATSAFDTARAFNQDISSWNVSHVTTFGWMFWYASAFNQPLNNWDVHSATTLIAMFNGATAFNQPLNNWNTSNVTIMDGTFGLTRSFNQDISMWNIGNLTSASNFAQLSNLSTDNYTKLLMGWSSQTIRSNVPLEVNSYYDYSATAARNKLLAAGWTITDLGVTNTPTPQLAQTGIPGEVGSQALDFALSLMIIGMVSLTISLARHRSF